MSKPQILPDLDTASQHCWQQLRGQILEILGARERVSVALSGGNTPRCLFKLMAIAGESFWPRVDFFWVDERCVPLQDGQNNAFNALQVLGDLPARFYRMDTSCVPAEAALRYEVALSDWLRDNGRDGLDIVLLGMGDDGHFASLFPGTAVLSHSGDRRVLENWVPQLGAWRVTLTASFIKKCGVRYLLAGGAEKLRVLEGAAADPSAWPVGLLLPKQEHDLNFLYR